MKFPLDLVPFAAILYIGGSNLKCCYDHLLYVMFLSGLPVCVGNTGNPCLHFNCEPWESLHFLIFDAGPIVVIPTIKYVSQVSMDNFERNTLVYIIFQLTAYKSAAKEHNIGLGATKQTDVFYLLISLTYP